jgi:hypothetical protein
MKVTKEELIEHFNLVTEKEDVNFTDGDDSLKLVLDDPKMTSQGFENVVGWLTEILFTGANLIHISDETSLTGVIFLNGLTSYSKKLHLNNSRVHRTNISNLARCAIVDSKLQDVSITSNGEIGEGITIKCSDLIGCNLANNFIDHSYVINRDLTGRTTLRDCRVVHSRLFFGVQTIANKRFSSVIIDAPQFSGDYFSIGLNGESAVGYINGAEKVIVVGEKKYNLGSWEDQFIKKEQNQFVRMMNQKKLEMMNMFFDSLAFK